MGSANSTKLLEMKSITKYIYDEQGRGLVATGIKILDAVDFDLFAGEVHVIMGENGAGKSTLMNVLGGVIEPDEGEILINGEKERIRNTAEARNKGIGFIHQEMNLCSNLDIAHNMFLGREPHNRLGLSKTKKMNSETAQMLSKLGFNIDPRTKLKNLSTAMQQIVEITKVMSYHSKILIMDEPTATLTGREVDILFKLIRDLRDSNIGIIYISHRMEEIEDLGDRFSVLRDGKLVGVMSKSEYSRAECMKMMAGRVVNLMYKSTHVPTKDEVFRVEGIKIGENTKPFDFQINKGEVVSFGGLVGAGRTELAKSIFGARQYYGGSIFFEGREYKKPSVSKSIRLGISYLTEDRKIEGLVQQMDIKSNTSMCVLDQVSPHLVLKTRQEAALAQNAINRFSVVCLGVNHRTGTLSGGNQQKVCLGKWFATEPKLLILDEPTRGIDVNAKAQIYEVIDQAAKDGMAVMVITSDMHELIGISDRIYIMHEGNLVTEIADKREMEQENLIKYFLNSDEACESEA